MPLILYVCLKASDDAQDGLPDCGKGTFAEYVRSQKRGDQEELKKWQKVKR